MRCGELSASQAGLPAPTRCPAIANRSLTATLSPDREPCPVAGTSGSPYSRHTVGSGDPAALVSDDGRLPAPTVAAADRPPRETTAPAAAASPRNDRRFTVRTCAALLNLSSSIGTFTSRPYRPKSRFLMTAWTPVVRSTTWETSKSAAADR